MIFRQIGSSIRVDGGASMSPEIELKRSNGGRMVKTAGYMLRIVSSSDPAARVGLKLYHGPDGIFKMSHSTPIPLAAPSDKLMGGDSAGGAMTLFEWLHPVLVGDNVAGKWVMVDVYEMLKPF